MIEAGKVYFCKTVDDAKAFLKECDKQNIVWEYDKALKASDEINFEYEDGTCYHPEIHHGDGRISLLISELQYVKDNYNDSDIIYYVPPLSKKEQKAINDGWQQLMQTKKELQQ